MCVWGGGNHFFRTLAVQFVSDCRFCLFVRFLSVMRLCKSWSSGMNIADFLCFYHYSQALLLPDYILKSTAEYCCAACGCPCTSSVLRSGHSFQRSVGDRMLPQQSKPSLGAAATRQWALDSDPSPHELLATMRHRVELSVTVTIALIVITVLVDWA